VKELSGEQRYIIASVAKGWSLDHDDSKPEIKVLAKASVCDRFLEVEIGGGDNPSITLNLLAAADAQKPLLLEIAEQFHLNA
jgi:hypothetical protein